MSLLNQSKLENLIDWPLLDICRNQHLTQAAVSLSQLFAEFNEISKSFQCLVREKKTIQDKYDNLYECYKKLESCDNCVVLQGCLNSQTNKINELEQIVKRNDGKATTSQSSAKSQDFITQIDQSAKPYLEQDFIKQIDKKLIHTDVKLVRVMTPNKNPSRQFLVEDDCALLETPTKKRNETGEIEDTIVGEQSSPILRKYKFSKINNKQRNPNETIKWKEEQQWKLSKDKSTPNKENDCFDLSPSLLTSSTENEHILEHLSLATINDTVEVVTESKTKKRKKLPKLNLSLTTIEKKKKCITDKPLKQSRLCFKNPKLKQSLDVTKTECFLGGMRNSPGNYDVDQIDVKLDDDFKVNLNRHNVSDDNDCINESPSCISHKPLRVKNIAELKMPEILCPRETSNSSMIIEDDDETMMFTIPENNKILTKNITPPNTKMQNLINQRLTPLKEFKPVSTFKSPIPEMIYKEDPIRKKADKAKVPGWSCAKCSEFYNVAFKGDEEMIKKKINECSKHRGKFNPERRSTPPGFWDVNMPQTPDTYDCHKD